MSTTKNLWSLLAIMVVTMLSLSIISCSKDDDDISKPTSKSTTYTLIWNTYTYSVEDVTIFEYTENGDKIGNHRIDKLEKNVPYKYIALANAAKVKVYFEIGGSPRWVQQVYYLEKSSNIDIEITDNSMIGKKEP